MKIEEVIAREEIRHTMAIYSTSGDRGRFEDLADTFTEDGVLDGRDGPVVGRKAIVESLNVARALRLKSAGEKVGFTRHNITTSRVEFDSDSEAKAWTYFFVATNFGLDHVGTYVDSLRKVGERWLFSNRRVKILWDSPVSPYHKSENGGVRAHE